MRRKHGMEIIPMDGVPADGAQATTESGAAGLASPRRSTRSGLLVRRLVGLGLILGIAYAVFHVVFLTDLLAPLLAYAAPIEQGIAWVAEDPMRAWIALAAIIVPHIGVYYMIFENK